MSKELYTQEYLRNGNTDIPAMQEPGYNKTLIIRQIMKRTVNVAIGGRSFILDEDAYNALGTYLDDFRKGIKNSKDGAMASEVMEELEMRIADLFKERLNGREVVDINIVNGVVAQLGMPDWKNETERGHEDGTCTKETPVRKFYRDLDSKAIGGVCSGLSLYFNVDVVLVRLIFIIALLLGSAGFWIYIILCIIAPAAKTATEKCELRGIPATAENIRRFSNGKK